MNDWPAQAGTRWDHLVSDPVQARWVYLHRPVSWHWLICLFIGHIIWPKQAARWTFYYCYRCGYSFRSAWHK